MNRELIIVLYLASIASLVVDCRVFGRCDLAHELLRQGFPRNDLHHWACLVEAESSGNTAAMNYQNTDGSWDWGLFQVSCSHFRPMRQSELHMYNDINIDME